MNLRKLMSLFAVLLCITVLSVVPACPAHADLLLTTFVFDANGDVIGETNVYVSSGGNTTSATTTGPAYGNDPAYIGSQVQTSSGYNSGMYVQPVYATGPGSDTYTYTAPDDTVPDTTNPNSGG